MAARSRSACGVVLLLLQGGAALGDPTTWDFERSAADMPPSGFRFARTGEGREARWVVRESAGAPSGTRVLVQTDLDDTSARFPLAIADAPTLRDVHVSVRCKPLSGRVDQACGVVVRYRDAGNYYVARANALEENVRLYHVKEGTRTQLESWSGPVEAGRWHTLTLSASGDRLVASWDGNDVLEVRDSTFSDAGRVGLWTKADSLTEFDDLSVSALHDDPHH